MNWWQTALIVAVIIVAGAALDRALMAWHNRRVARLNDELARRRRQQAARQAFDEQMAAHHPRLGMTGRDS